MKKVFNLIGLALVLLLAFSSCQKAPFLSFTGQKSFTFTDAGGSETITFTCNRAWSVTSSESWLTVSPAKGGANEEGAKVTITCAANTTYDPRNATVTILSEGLSESISVSQDSNYGLMLEPTTFNLTNAAQSIEVEVKANVEYTIAIDDACKDWISQVVTKALSSNKLTFSIAANESYDDREGKITISQKGAATSVQPQVITVKQSQTNGLIVDKKEYIIDREGGSIEIKFKTNVKIDAVISESDKDWVSLIDNSTKALSNESISFSISENTTFCQRNASIELSGDGVKEIIVISQNHADIINVNTPGSLKQLLTNIGNEKIKYLALTGTLNDSDFATLCIGLPNLKCLDLSEITNTSLSVGQFRDQATITNYILPNGLTKIPDMCFNNSGAQYVRMPDCVVEIGVDAFKKSRLKEITFPKSLLSIKEGAFALCKLLNCDLTFNDNLQSIGQYAFNECRSIKYLAPLPTSLKQIEDRAFMYCSSMKGNLIIPEGCSVGVGAFHFCYAIESLSLPDSMVAISDLAFCHLSSIKSISFPKKLRVIGEGAFAYCSSVSGDLIIPDTVETIEKEAFRGCSSYDGILLIGSNCKLIGTDEHFVSFEGTKFNKIYCKASTPPSVVIRGGKYNVGIRQTYLGVPAGTLSLYKSAEYWKDFTYIEEVDFNNL